MAFADFPEQKLVVELLQRSLERGRLGDLEFAALQRQLCGGGEYFRPYGGGQLPG